MKRRNLLGIGAAAAIAVSAPEKWRSAVSTNDAATKKANLKLGTQHGDSPEILRVLAGLGVNHICATLTPSEKAEEWSIEALVHKREQIESFGIKADALRLLYPTTIAKSEIPNVMLGKSPERDRDIDLVCNRIRNASRAGFPMLTYNLSILGVVRTKPTPGRGGVPYSTFNYQETTDRDELTEAGSVSAEQGWERIEYFVKRVMPVAEEYRVRMACHPHDPPMPEPQGFRGVHRLLGTVPGLKKFMALTPNPYHGLNFCQGTICEGLKNPNEEIHEVIRYFGSRRRIFNVHFRNIKGGFLNFQETFPDNGDVNFIRAIRTYKEVGYDGMLMPDHVPKIEGDSGGREAFAYCFGYIQALLQMINNEG